MKSYIDLVIGGPDMSGTSTQAQDLINFFRTTGKVVRDLRGTEIHAMFHAKEFGYTSGYFGLDDWFADTSTDITAKEDFLFSAFNHLRELRLASCLNNHTGPFIDPESADVWILEEPTKRGAGQVNRFIEQQRSAFGSSLDPIAAAMDHQAYRIDEFLRFRRVMREKGKIIIRSRSEESACYQVYDETKLPNGISQNDYLALPGHKVAFAHPPTHIFIVCGDANWTREDLLKLKQERCGDRQLDDHEKNADYQLLVNHRYATDWLENLYEVGCRQNGSRPPIITRFNICDSKEDIRGQMISQLEQMILTA